MTNISELTSMRVGGKPASLTICETREDLISKTTALWQSGDDWMILGGGTNVVVSDSIENLNVILVQTKGIEKQVLKRKQIWRVQAGENWDELVAQTVEAGLAGIEAMSGIPGSTGGSPVQNIGAYGQELSDVFMRCEFLDYETCELLILEPKDMRFGYRDSAIKQGRTGLITWIEIELLDMDGLARPLYSGQIAGDLNSSMGAQPALVNVRESVLKLRSAKGMVLDSLDPNSVSCGSFFTNPIVCESFARTLPSDAPSWNSPDDDSEKVKLSAAWLIEQAGIGRGFSLAGSKAAISSKHALAIVNTGGASANEILELARYVQERVAASFGVNLVPEPNLIGFNS